MKLYRTIIKRAIDIAASGCALAVLAVPLAAVAVWLHFANKGAGVLFRQERPGKGGKIFTILKFKSMTDERDADGNLLPDAERLTAAGRLVRLTSIDELPQLWNVLKGDMSLIGPRPLLTRYLPYYTAEEMHRHDVLPGITGLAQVHGRSTNSWQDMFAKDVEYVNNLSFLLDCKIFYLTIKHVISRKDIRVVPAGIYLDATRQKSIDK